MIAQISSEHNFWPYYPAVAINKDVEMERPKASTRRWQRLKKTLDATRFRG